MKARHHKAVVLIVLGLLLSAACANPRISEADLPETGYGRTLPLLEGVLDREPHIPESTMSRTPPFFKNFLGPSYLPDSTMGRTPPLSEYLLGTPNIPDATMDRILPQAEHFLPKTPYLPDPSFSRTPPSFMPVLDRTPHLPEPTMK